MRTNEERITQGIEQKVRALGGSVKAGPRVISHGELTPSRERICVSGRQLREVAGQLLRNSLRPTFHLRSSTAAGFCHAYTIYPTSLENRSEERRVGVANCSPGRK